MCVWCDVCVIPISFVCGGVCGEEEERMVVFVCIYVCEREREREREKKRE